jgi:uncharacterized membrane protein
MLNKGTAFLFSMISVASYIVYWNTTDFPITATIMIFVSFITALLSITITLKLQKRGERSKLMTATKIIDIVFLIISGIGVFIALSFFFVFR